MNKKNY